MSWEIVVGIETHAQLATRSKQFSGASTAFGAAPNTQACAVDIALPGVLPVLNQASVELAVRFGLAVGGAEAINRRSIFARKNYFYPDLPKGYQISQYELPIVKGGEISIFSATRGEIKVRLTRAHLEEDAGKSLHGEAISGIVGLGVVGVMDVGSPVRNEQRDLTKLTAIDLNRAGTPLLEIVTEPDMRSAQEAVAYAKALHALVKWIGICDGNMQEGSFRCDANVSVRKAGASELGTRCEIKNLNSFRFLERAIDYEAKRQIAVLEDGGKIAQETRLYDPDRDETRSMRTKEDAQDYRYFPDPDLLPLVITEEQIERIRDALPELPDAKRAQFIEKFAIPSQTASALTSSRDESDFFEKIALYIAKEISPSDNRYFEVVKSTANSVIGEVTAALSEAGRDFSNNPISETDWAEVRLRIADGTISGKIAKEEILPALLRGEGSTDQIIEKRGLKQISDGGAIEKLVDEVLAANPKQVEDYRSGKEKAFNSLVGQVMKATKGKANPAQVNELLRRKLGG